MPDEFKKLVTYKKPKRIRYSTEADPIRSTNKWKKFSKMVRNEYPICQQEGCQRPSQHVHHIVPIVENPELAFSYPNLVPLCIKHHNYVEGRPDRLKIDKYKEDIKKKGYL